ncbi:unnamed protein product [Blepharisma stoltei]|uniref:Uncharacterized protein n=1 Tax=Blepharisma stoltei TaxID=1481888 RepID=A0AAU9JQB8_9CILI|nr:unnamed protein product [Blepharisma stoltei]
MSLQNDPILSEVMLNTLEESKKLEKSGRLRDALVKIEKISFDALNAKLPFSKNIIQQVVQLCNKIFSQDSKLKWLRRAEQILTAFFSKTQEFLDEKMFRLMMLTYNNWATYHQSLKKPSNALSYLIRAVKFYEDHNVSSPESLQIAAKTMLNMSAIYSEIHKFKKARAIAEKSLFILQDELKQRLENRSLEQLSEFEKKKVENLIKTYIIAFYDIGVAEESLGNLKSAVKAYRNAVSIGKQFIAKNDETLVIAQEALVDASSKLSEKSLDKKIKPMTSKEFTRILKNHKRNISSETEYQKSLSELKLSLDKPADQPLSPALSEIGLSPIHMKDEPKKPERYYSDEQLRLYQKKLNQRSNRFISADEYFFSKLSKAFEVKTDKIRPYSAAGLKRFQNSEKIDRKIISELRLKKRSILGNPSFSNRDFDAVFQRIEQMKKEDVERSKKNEITMKSKLKTRVYKDVLQVLNSNQASQPNKIYPQQRLYFKPPVRLDFQMHHSATIEMTAKKMIRPAASNNIDNANKEIEEIIDNLHIDMKNSDEHLETEAANKNSETKEEPACELVQSILDKAKKALKTIPIVKRTPMKRATTAAVFQTFSYMPK